MIVNRRPQHPLLRHLIWAVPVLLAIVAVPSCFRSAGLLLTRVDYVAGHNGQVSTSFYSFMFLEGDLIFGSLDHVWVPVDRSIPRTHRSHLQFIWNELDGIYQRNGSHSWRIPVGRISLILAIAPLCFWIKAAIAHDRLIRERAERARGKCVKCGYDLRATPTRCPECGVVPTVVEKRK